ncbi:YdcF family protein [Belliella sp. R4-6]|uniref:YdcF family protein n=1 Tax=Belliella alkalica TaxID=1730871 RepID=A0ABS9V6J5_9BACT|nr:YdcF family protein [Belliella alkalica]MCH7412040.1 YdcF family protein [Belliella alkalica]
MVILLNPLLYLLLGLTVIWFSKHRTGALLWLVCLYFFSNPIIINSLIQRKEADFPPLEFMNLDHNLTYHILVLGAGKNDDLRLAGNQRLSKEVLTRLVEGIKWMRKLPNAILICSGPKVNGDKSQAELVKETAMLLGLPAERVSIQELVYNTRTEADVYIQQYGINTPLILCTSALHTPRAVRTFELAGVKSVIASPSSYLTPNKNTNWGDFIPDIRSFEKWQTYLKEIIGLFIIHKITSEKTKNKAILIQYPN